MRQLLSLTVVTVGVGSAAALASIDPKIAEFCLKAQDFQGCVNSMSEKKPDATEKRITIDMDKIRTTGNFCPSNYGYVGAGYCENIVCRSAWGEHDSRLGGKGWSCKGGSLLQFDGTAIRATTDERCPMVEPEIGRQSSCQNGLTEEQVKQGYITFVFKSESRDKSFGFRYSQKQRESKVSLDFVEPKCVSYKSGLRSGDEITEINGKPLADSQSLTSQRFRELADSDTPVAITYRRFGESRTISLLPGPCIFAERIETGRQNPQTGAWEKLN